MRMRGWRPQPDAKRGDDGQQQKPKSPHMPMMPELSAAAK
jgi:hypothetical protein